MGLTFARLCISIPLKAQYRVIFIIKVVNVCSHIKTFYVYINVSFLGSAVAQLVEHFKAGN